MTAPSADIRPFEPEDLPVVQRVREAAFRPVFRSFAANMGEEIASMAFAHADAEQTRLLDSVREAGSGHQVLVAVAGGAVVGFVSFSMDADKRTGEIGLDAARPDHAGRGIGTGMYERAPARMKESGMALAAAGTGGDPSHAPARRAYE